MSWKSCVKADCVVLECDLAERPHLSAAYGFVDVESSLVKWVIVSPRSCSRRSGSMNYGVPFMVDSISRLSL